MNNVEKITFIWDLRLAQKNDESIIAFSKLKTDLSDKALETNDAITFKSLESSITRLESQGRSNSNALRELKNEYCADKLWNNFYYCLEMGVTNYSKSKYFEALNFFERALKCSKTEVHRTICYSNMYLICEYLDLPTEGYFKKIQGMDLSKIKNTGIIDQIDYIKLARLWNMGDIESFKAISIKRPCQALYFKSYVQNLPYINSDQGIDPEAFINLKNIYLGEYRLRTITGQENEDDLSVTNMTNVIDRLYLWFWRWIESPRKFPLSKFKNIIETISLFDLEAIDVNPRAKLRNIFLWLEVLGGIQYSTFSKAISFEKNDTGEDKYLQSEKEYLINIINNKANSSVDNIFNLKISNNDNFEYLSKTINNINENNVIDPNCEFTIDQNTYRVFSKSGETLIISKIIVQALSSLWNKDTISCDKFFFDTYERGNYESFEDYHKIWNILSRIKKTFENVFEFSVKNEKIYIDVDWSLFSIKAQNAYRKNIDAQRILNVLNNVFNLGDKPQSITPVQKETEQSNKTLADFKGKWVKRQELETLFNVSKSTMGRMLKKWKEKNMISQDGKGKNIVYKLADDFNEENL